MRKNKQFGVKAVSLALALTMTCSFSFGSLGTLQVHASEFDGIEDESGVTLYDPFVRMNFGDMFDEELLLCSDTSKITATRSEANEGVIYTGKNDKMKAATFTIDQTLDFGDEGANRVMIDAVAKRGTKTYIQVFVDDETEPVAETRIIAQKREDNWNRYSEGNVLLNKQLTGEHTIHLKIVDTDTEDDKKTTFLFRSIKFVRDIIPVINLDIDESYGSIDDMNQDKEHKTECYGDMSIVVPDGYENEFDIQGEESYTGGTYQLDYIRGRGNSSWGVEKKPYKIKLDKSNDLFNMGANKHWVLLANWFDDSLVRNRMTYWLGRELGMEYTPKCVSVDVYMNNEYLGNYLLCEQIRVDENRVNIFDLEKEYDKKDMSESDNLSGGYLLSMKPYGDEMGYGFKTDHGCTFYLESPESKYNTALNERLDIEPNHYSNYIMDDYAVGMMSDEENANSIEPDESEYALANAYIKNYVQKVEDAIFSPDFEYVDENGEAHSYAEYMDVDSAVKYFWMQELSLNTDAYNTPSTYLYKDKDGKLCWGPLWDFDYAAWGSMDHSDYDDEDNANYGGWLRSNVWFEQLMGDKEFVQKVNDFWKNELKPAMESVVAEDGLLDQYQKELEPSAYNNFDKYGVKGGGINGEDDYFAPYYEDTYETQEFIYASEIERLKNWINHRIDWVDANLSTLPPRDVEVKFMLDGKLYKSLEAKTNRNIGYENMPEVPEKDGYEFVGWNLADADEETLLDPEGYINDYMVDENGVVILEAYFVEEDKPVPAECVHIPQKDIYNILWDDEETNEANGIFIPYTCLPYGMHELTWTSSNEEVAVVNEEGYVIAKGIGDAVITVTSSDGKNASANVHIIDQTDVDPDDSYIKDIVFSDTKVTLKPNEKKGISFTTDPEMVLYPSNVVYLEWYSLNEDVVTVEDGVLEAKNPGKAYVVAIYQTYGDYIWTYCEVTVEGDAKTPVTKPDNNKGNGTEVGKPDTKPGTTPVTKPGSNGSQTTTESNSSEEAIKVNTTFDAANLKYVVTSASKCEVAVTGVKKLAKSKLEIPDTVTYGGKTFKVTSIAKNAFANNKKIKSLVIGSNVKKIGAKAFYKCKKCKSITIKSSVLKKPGKQAFKKISKKAKITVPAKKLKKYKKWFKGYKVISAK